RTRISTGAGQRLAVLGGDDHVDPGGRSAGSGLVRPGSGQSAGGGHGHVPRRLGAGVHPAGPYTAADTRPASTTRGDIAEGLVWLARHPLLRILCLLLCAMKRDARGGRGGARAVRVLVLYVFQVLHVGNLGYSLLLAVLAVGGITGTILVPVVRRTMAST